MKRKGRGLKKKLEDFIKDESGLISKDKVLKIGLGTVSALGIMSAFSSNLIASHSSHSQHINTVAPGPAPGHPGCKSILHSSHASHGSHTSY